MDAALETAVVPFHLIGQNAGARPLQLFDASDRSQQTVPDMPNSMALAKIVGHGVPSCQKVDARENPSAPFGLIEFQSGTKRRSVARLGNLASAGALRQFPSVLALRQGATSSESRNIGARCRAATVRMVASCGRSWKRAFDLFLVPRVVGDRVNDTALFLLVRKLIH